MSQTRLKTQNFNLKFSLTIYLILSMIGFLIAALISKDRYNFSHQQTVIFYLGDEAQMAFPKLFSQLIQGAHVHSFMMPVLFFIIWFAMTWVPVRSLWKTIFVLGGGASILLYNAAPFLVRYQSAQWVWLFTVGGIGLFFFYFVPALLICYETWIGFSGERVI